MLYPQTNDHRLTFSLDGVWDFRTAGADVYPVEWTVHPLPDPLPMAVPGSYNEQSDVENLRAHYGWVVYQRAFALPRCLTDGQRVALRFDAATHAAEVHLNGERLGGHVGGFLPFEFDVTDRLREGDNLLAVAVDNRVGQSTLPVGNEGGVAFFGSDNAGIPSIEAAKRHAKPQNMPNFDFFNYAGLNRHVELYTTPRDAYIDDVAIVTASIADDPQPDDPHSPRRTASSAELSYDVTVAGPQAEGTTVEVAIVDAEGTTVTHGTAITADGHANGTINVTDARLWNPGAAYLYTACIRLKPAPDADPTRVAIADEGAPRNRTDGTAHPIADEYRQTFGIRTVAAHGTQFLINGRPFYFKGAAKHEDSFFRGRGTDPLLNVKDLSLFHWLGANSFRTSHYPYAENMYDLCDREGIVIIDEVPAVGMGWAQYTNETIQRHHRDVIRDMIARDKNHPSVVMWSLANEPRLDGDHGDMAQSQLAHDYFIPLYDLAHGLDPQNRPVTIVCCQNDYAKDLTTRLMDVVCLNRYYGWYNLSGDLDAACEALNIELDFWAVIGKPVMFTEYGADTIEGYHGTHGEMFSEEFQRDFYARIDAEIDKRPWFIGEQLWNFADFSTVQGPMRVEGNRKGILTRDRQPKMAAHWLRRRWTSIPDFGYKD